MEWPKEPERPRRTANLDEPISFDIDVFKKRSESEQLPKEEPMFRPAEPAKEEPAKEAPVKEEPGKEAPAEPTTKVCPFCQSEISIKAVKCPNCTSDIPEEE